MRYSKQLFLLVLSVLIPACLASAVAVWYVYHEEQRGQERGLREATRAFSLLVANELQTKEGILKTLANSTVLEQGDLEEFYTFAKRNAPTNETAIILVDNNNKYLFNTRQPFGSELPEGRSSNLQQLAERYGGEKTIISDVFRARQGGGFDFALQVPVRIAGEIKYHLVMSVNASEMQPFLIQQGFPKEWLGVIVDRNGVIVSRTRSPDQFIGKSASSSIVKQLKSETEGVFHSVTLDGQPVKTFFSRVPLSQWTVVLSIPESELRQTPLRVASFLAVVMAVLLCLALLAARILSARMMKPMQKLNESADKLGRGEEVSYRARGLVEVDAVGERIAEASRKIRLHQLELERQVAQAVESTARAERALLQAQKLEAVGRLTGGIAHEFNNLLQTLATALQLAGMVTTQERVRSLIDTCNKAVERATTLTSKLSSFGRVQDAKLETQDLTAQIATAEQLLRTTLPVKVNLQVHIADGLWPAKLDPTQFELALINLVINAKDAMPSGGTIAIKAQNETLSTPPAGLQPGDYVHIQVIDTGSGMSPDIMERALDPFFTTKKVGEGTGLGLPQAHGFARQSQGVLLLQSTQGRGTTVSIYLPRSTQAVMKDREAAQEQGSIFTVQGRLLFVEDDLLVRDAVVPALEEAGFSVLTAANADEALALLKSGITVDALFSDIVMPGSISGRALAETVRAEYPEVKVVLASGYSEERITLSDVKILAKPYDIAAVVDALMVAVK